MNVQTKLAVAPIVVNGVNVDALLGTLEAAKTDANIAQFRFSATNRWIGGGHNRSMIGGFEHAGGPDQTRTARFELDADEPPVLLGADTGANPVEFVLHALIACMTTTMVYHAAARGIAIEGVESRLEGDLDLRGFLGIAPGVRPGYQEVRVMMKVKSAADPAVLAELTTFSPVRDTISKSVPVKVVVETH